MPYVSKMELSMSYTSGQVIVMNFVNNIYIKQYKFH